MSEHSPLADAIPILMSWDRCLGYIRLWKDEKLSDSDTLHALIEEIATTNGEVNRRMVGR